MNATDAGKRLATATAGMFTAIGDKVGLDFLKECKGVYAEAQQTAERNGADAVGGVVAGVTAVLDFTQKDQPSLFEELRAMFRAGREDLLNTLSGLNPTREAGAPGTPTQAMVTNSLVGLDFGAKANDVITLTRANDQQQQNDGRDGR